MDCCLPTSTSWEDGEDAGTAGFQHARHGEDGVDLNNDRCILVVETNPIIKTLRHISNNILKGKKGRTD